MRSLILLALAGCSAAADNAVLAVDPSVPPLTTCAIGFQVCQNGAPWVCSVTGDRLWPALPPNADGSPGVCPNGCIVVSTSVLPPASVAYCRGSIEPTVHVLNARVSP